MRAGRTDTIALNGRAATSTYDAAGRLTTQTLPDLREIHPTYVANRNVASVTPPSRPAHALTHTPADLVAQYEYDGNGNRLSVTRPGIRTVSGTCDAQDGC